MTDETPRTAPKRKPGHLKTAGKLLCKEARKIVAKYRARLGDEMADKIEVVCVQVDAKLAEKNWLELEPYCEELDELLHKYASFARKGALRETAENVGMAVLVALGLRSCLYEPFKIPSPSMVPTLVPGDHIFVNKFRYGIQIPFTTTIVAKDMFGSIERGEVVVFRYPLDESQDYIKRVIGLPGDVIRVKDEHISIQRPGAEDFEFVKRKRLKQPCPDNFGHGSVNNCVLFEETLDGHKYVVKIDKRSPGATRGRTRTITVPEGSLMVMGDNRRHSADSLQWSRRLEAVYADKLITDKDLRDLTKGRIFKDERNLVFSTDADRDEVSYISERNSARHDMRLQVWRNPGLGVRAVYAAASEGMRGVGIDELVRSEPGDLSKATRRRIGEARERFLALATLEDTDVRHGAMRVHGADGEREVVVRLSCGRDVCPSAGSFARELLAVADAIDADEARPARELLRRPGGFSYTPKWSGRDGVRSRYFDQRFHIAGKSTDKTGVLRVRAWRQPGEGEDFIAASLDAAFGQGTTLDARQYEAFEAPDQLHIVTQDGAYVVHGSVAERRVHFAIECGERYCTNESDALNLAGAVAKRARRSATESKMLERLVSRQWLAKGVKGLSKHTWTAGPALGEDDLYEWDQLSLVSRIRDSSRFARVYVERMAAQELSERLAERRAELSGATDVEFVRGFEVEQSAGQDAFVHVFIEPDTQAFIEIRCSRELCETMDTARELAKRAADKARDVSNFVDPDFMLDTPFVPRGNVKGRAERIWARAPEPDSILPYRLSFEEIR